MRNPHDTRVVITGLGTINPLGNTVDDFWDALTHGKSGVRLTQNTQVGDYPVKIAGEIDIPDLSSYFEKSKKMLRRFDRHVIFGHVAGMQALIDSGIDVEKNPHRYGVIIGSGEGGLDSHLQNVTRLLERGMESVQAFYVVNAIPNTAAGFLAKTANLQGVNFAVCSACASGSHAIATAAGFVKLGMADAVIAGGTEATTNVLAVAAFGKIMALSERSDSPETASRPFDKDRDGFVLSEGAAMVCVEDLEHAKKRGAQIYAEITGIGMSCDAHDMVAPHPNGRGASQAVKQALKDASLNPKDIGLINAHATSTEIGDRSESTAIENSMGDHARTVPVQATKSMTGHMIGAAGPIGIIASIMAFERGVIHHSINIFEQDPSIHLNVLKDEPIESRINNILTEAFAFGGHNVAIILSRYEG